MRHKDPDTRVKKTALSFAAAGAIVGAAMAGLVIAMQAEAAKAILLAASAGEGTGYSTNVERLSVNGQGEQSGMPGGEPFLAAAAFSSAPSGLAIKDAPRLPLPPPDIGPGATASVLPLPSVTPPFPLPSVSARFPVPIRTAAFPATSGSSRVLGPLASVPGAPVPVPPLPVPSNSNAGAPVGAAAASTPARSAAPLASQPLPKSVLAQGVTYCGSGTCDVGSKCCCDRCVPYSEECSPSSCGASSGLSVSVACGMNLCTSGLVCCNASCGTCVRAGETCSDKQCN